MARFCRRSSKRLLLLLLFLLLLHVSARSSSVRKLQSKQWRKNKAPKKQTEDDKKKQRVEQVERTDQRRRRHALESLLLGGQHSLYYSSSSSSKNVTESSDDNTTTSSQSHRRQKTLVEWMGHEIYQCIKGPKYKFYIYMTIGTLPNEESTIACLSLICNVLYGLVIWWGFLLLPRTRMLLVTVLTLYVGPAVILIILGSLVALITAFALYPTLSVLGLLAWFFLGSSLAQVLGSWLGMDSDNDGDVDWLDFLHWAGTKTNWGPMIGLDVLYGICNYCFHARHDPLAHIHDRLDQLAESVEASQRSLSIMRMQSSAELESLRAEEEDHKTCSTSGSGSTSDGSSKETKKELPERKKASSSWRNPLAASSSP